MNKSDLVKKIAVKSGLTQVQATAALAAALEAVQAAVADGEKVQLAGFGTFEVKERAARTGRNPATGAAITIPASKSPVFKAGKGFKDLFK